MIPAHNGKGTVTVRKFVTLDPRKTAAQVRDAWIGEQAKYHDRNARTMHAMHHRMEQIATLLSWSVIAVVGFDLLLIGGKILHWLPESCVPFAKAATPWMIFISAVLPAAVAALGGIRFQSECHLRYFAKHNQIQDGPIPRTHNSGSPTWDLPDFV